MSFDNGDDFYMRLKFSKPDVNGKYHTFLKDPITIRQGEKVSVCLVDIAYQNRTQFVNSKKFTWDLACPRLTGLNVTPPPPPPSPSVSYHRQLQREKQSRQQQQQEQQHQRQQQQQRRRQQPQQPQPRPQQQQLQQYPAAWCRQSQTSLPQTQSVCYPLGEQPLGRR